jgi:hydrogenase nickel incorporation protein HypA/HybF
MHELSITNDILKIVVKYAKREHAAQVHRVTLVVSELSDLQPIWIQRYFDRISEGTVAHGARLEIEHQAPEFLCNGPGCGVRFAVSLRTIDRIVCSRCGCDDCTIIGAADYTVEEIEVSQ